MQFVFIKCLLIIKNKRGNGLLHVGSGDIHGVMLCVVRVADAGEHIRNGIGNLHETLPPVKITGTVAAIRTLLG